MNILEIKDLSYKYKNYNEDSLVSRNTEPALSGINLSVPEGSIVILSGPTGCGKSTLLKLLKSEIAPTGEKTGSVVIDGKELSALTQREKAEKIALLMQNTEDQIVTDKVWHEIAYGLENLGVSKSEAENRVAEIISFFRLESIAKKDTSSLSGGQKQMVLLASLFALSPRLLLLDEPISQQDPESSELFINTLQRLHDQLGITIIIAEHKIESLLPLSDLLVVMDRGRTVCSDSPEKAINTFHSLLPPLNKLCVIDKSRDFYNSDENSVFSDKKSKNAIYSSSDKKPLLKADNIYFRYSRGESDVISGLNASFDKGLIYAIFGCNAAGKTTFLNLISGILKVQEGRIIKDPKKLKTAYMPQNVELLFISETVRGELSSVGYEKNDIPDYISPSLFDRSPYDLSGGEKQLLALAKLTAASHDLILLDEPTKGLDTKSEKIMLDILKRFTKNGVTVIMSTHDLTFAKEAADYCSIMSMGRITGFKGTKDFFSENRLYTI